MEGVQSVFGEYEMAYFGLSPDGYGGRALWGVVSWLISCGGQSVFIYVVVVVVLDYGGRSRSGACDEEWWSCFGDFLFNFLVVVKDGDDKSFWPLAPCERPSAETLFELICTWLHKGNYCESATKHDQPETEGPVG
ncbi:hypothetical protein Tco_1158889, partial [Tanacetum coccineum]